MRDKPAIGEVATLAARQHGVVSTQQLLTTGLTRAGISRRVRGSQLHRVHRGVYAVGHAGLSPHGRWMAAVLAIRTDGSPAGHGAVLSHRSAAMLWRLLPPASGPIDVSVPGLGGRSPRSGIRLHRSGSLLPEMTTCRRGIPVTTPIRTIADLRSAVARGRRGAIDPKALRQAIRQAEVLGLPLATETDRTRSELERSFLRLCRKHGIPPPEVNVRIESLLVDFLWRDSRLVVETDGYRYHRGRAAFEDDRNRDLRLKALGYEVVRLSYRQVVDEPARVAAALKAMAG